ncbi:MAG: hypothetical protein KC547_03535 [Anaerolineae bacterium]|nr:hypothetical protein [Anaerolineae bacterium]MCA9911060.1 hypothetical protein [Anaerolineae bacterium]
MRRIKIILPATITDLGPALGGIGLAVGLYTTIEISERSDDNLHVETEGEDAGRYSVGLRHPVVLGLMRVFQLLEKTVLGLNVRIENQIPHSAGLGVEAIYMVAGIVGANNLLGTPFNRSQILELCAQETSRPNQATAAILGGLTVAVLDNDTLIYRSLPVETFQLVIVAPDLDEYAEALRDAVPERVLLRDAAANLARVPLLLDALRSGDMYLLDQVADDRLYAPHIREHLPGFHEAVAAARRAGAKSLLLARGGILIAFAEHDHRQIAQAMQAALQNAGSTVHYWVLPIDRQGIVISVAQTG